MRIKRLTNNSATKTRIEEQIDLSLLDKVIAKYRNQKGNLIPVLQSVMDLYGYLPEKALIKIEQELNISLTKIYGVASFYSQFKLKPVGKHIIKVCHGTACHVQNAENLTSSISDFLNIKDGETTQDGFFTLESVACLGCCSLAPVIMIDEEVYGNLDGTKAVKIINEYIK